MRERERERERERKRMFGADLAILSPSSHVNATLITIRLQFDNENGRRVYKGEEN